VTARSKKTDAARPVVSGSCPTDFASRVNARLDALRVRLERPDALVEVVRGANTPLDPHQMAAWLVWQAGEWLAAPYPAGPSWCQTSMAR
jgi:hypothetical protein